eukprot:gene33817-40918_t
MSAAPHIRTFATTTSEAVRLDPDPDLLINWIQAHSGQFDLDILQEKDGWSLITKTAAEKDAVLATVPKKLCIFSKPELMESPLTTNAVTLMDSLGTEHWRTRLAVGLLSERVRSDSFFRPYLANLPFAFPGLPCFYDAQEFRAIQDASLLHTSRERCAFLNDFAENVLKPLHRSAQDPFNGHFVDANVLGWAFGSACSRGFRFLAEGAVLVPGLDLCQHSPQPSCAVRDRGDAFQLVALEPLGKGAAATVSYGPLTNEELLGDFGFSLHRNPHEAVSLACDASTLRAAASILGESAEAAEGYERVLRSPGLWQQAWLR